MIDIGPGCTQLPRLGIAHAERLRQELHLVDCEEMLALLPDSPGVKRTAARFPDCPALLDRLRGRTDAVLAYSILQCVFTDGDAWRFFDAALDLLAPGGHALFGDVANISMRKRLYASDAGKAFHRRFTGRDEDPDVGHGRIEHGAIDDGVLMGMVQRARAAGFHAFLLPQPATLPMHNRREDLLVVRP